MRKVVFVASHYYPHVFGGAEISVQALAEELTRRGIATSVISLAHDGVAATDEVNGITVHRIASRDPYHPSKREPVHRRVVRHLRDINHAGMATKVGRLLDQERPDWVSTHNLAGLSVAVWSAAKSRGLRLSHSIHDYYLMCPRTTMYSDEQRCARPCTSCRAFAAPKKIASRQVDVVIGVSRFVLDRHLQDGFFPSAQRAIVHNGSAWRDAAPVVEGAHAGPLRVGFIGRIERTKGIEVLLEAVTRLAPGRVQLRIAGQAHDAAYLKQLQQRFPIRDVSYLGFVAPSEFYASIDVLVVPSLWEEAFGMVAVEALGYAVPVLASRVGGLQEIVEHAQCGWLFEPGNAAELSARLRQILDAWPERAQMQRNALARGRWFTVERQGDDFLSAVDY